MNRIAKTNAPKGDGLDAAHDQPVKTLTKYATDFIAAIARYASANTEFNILFLVLTFQFVAIVWGVL